MFRVCYVTATIFLIDVLFLYVCELFSRRQKPLEHFKVQEFFSFLSCFIVYFFTQPQIVWWMKNSNMPLRIHATVQLKNNGKEGGGSSNFTWITKYDWGAAINSLAFFSRRWTHLLNQWLLWFICRRAKYTSISELSK